MQDHRAAGLGERSCSGEPQQLPPPCATAPKRHYEQRGWKRGDPGSEGRHHKLGQQGKGWEAEESGEGLPHRYVATGSRARARGFPRCPVGIQQRLSFHPLEVPLRGMEANPKVKSHIGQAGCDECYSPPEERVMSDRAAPAHAELAIWGDCVRGDRVLHGAGPTLL